MTLNPIGNPYTGSPTVKPGVTLTVEPGVKLTLGELVVQGTLKAEGTAEDPIRFTGAKEEASGEWRSIFFKAGSGASVLDHVEVANGGSRDSGYLLCNNAAVTVDGGASPTIVNSTIRMACGYGVKVNAGGSPEIADNSFIKSGTAQEAISYSAQEGQTGEVNIHDNYIEKGAAGIKVWIYPSAGTVFGAALQDNTVSGTSGKGLIYSGSDIPGGVTDNTLAGNKSNLIEIGGTVGHSSTWSKGGSAVLVEGLKVAAGVVLTINPGVHLLQPTMTVEGTLKAEGTAEDPIRFTGAKEEASGEWRSIFFKAGSGASVLDHVEVANGGSRDSGYFECNNAAVTVEQGASPKIVNSTIRLACGYGVKVNEGGASEIANNSFIKSGTAHEAIYYTAQEKQTGEIKIHDNYIEKGGAGIKVWIYPSAGTVVGATLQDNTIVSTSGTGLIYSGPDIPTGVTENTLVGNKTNLIEIDGKVGHSSTWNDEGVPVRVSSEIAIPAGVTLTIAHGIYIEKPNMTVKGTLEVEGTSEDPVVLTGVKRELSGEWKSIVFEPGSGKSLIDYAEVSFGGSVSGSGMIEAKGSHPTITHSTIRVASWYGIKVTESGSPKIEWNRFKGGGSGVSYSGTGTLSAPSNDWGCTSGPSPAGCGAPVTSNVKWDPAIQLPELGGQCRGKESQCGEGADPVSLATGALTYSHRDLVLTNKSSVPLEFARTYSSASTADAGLGTGWSQSGIATASALGSGDVLIVGRDGRQDLFEKSESGYQAPSGVTDSLAKIEGTFQLTTLERTVYRFNSSGRIASITDDHGLKTTYAYNAEGRLATITDPSAQTLTFSYNSANRITSIKDSTGREVKFAYSGLYLESVTDALGGVTKYSYDSAKRLASITDPRGNVILKNTYDGQGRVVEQRDGLNNLWTLEYKPSETIVTEPEGGKLKYGFDSQSRIISETDQLSHVTTTSYDAAGNIDEIVKPGGAKWQFGHDAKGNLTSVVNPEEGERAYEYDSLNRLTNFTDEREETWTYEWSETNDLKKVADPAEGETTATYNASGQPLTVTDPNEHTTTFTYDARGNRLTAKDALEHTTAYAHNTRNQLTSKTEPGLKAETYGRNALGDLLSVTTPEGNKTEYTYDANGMPTQVKDPAANVWKIERNAMERPTAYIDPLGQKTEISYNGNLMPIKVVDRRGKETSYAYDLANQATEIVRPEGGDWEFGYDARGNRTEVVEPRENATTYEFDLLNRMTEVSEPLEATTSYGYDPTGNLTSFTDPRENTTELSYDELGQLTEIDQPLEKTTSFTYDGVGNRRTRTTAAGTLDFGYDAADRLEDITAGESVLRAFDYDPAGRLIGATDAQTDEIEVGYDDDGRLTSIDDGRSQSVSRAYDSRGNVIEQTDGRGVLEYGYDKLSRMTGLTDPQGKALGFGYDPEGNLTEIELPNGVVTTNAYDDAGRLAETTSEKGETVLESLGYGYDPAGNRISQVDRLSQETTYEYDALNRLTEFDLPGEGSTAYGYDSAGNRTQAGATTFEFNDLNQMTSSSNGTTYDYDDAGRLIEVDEGETSTTYAWNSFDELANVATGAQEVDYAYDALGRQILRDDGSAIRLTHYGDLSDLPILDTDAEGEPTMSYVQGPSGLIEQRSGEATGFPLRDAHGDITSVADAEGEVASRQTYEPWGEQLSGPSLEMGWLGAQERRSDGATGLVQMGIRPYGPASGSFIAEDPILGTSGESRSLNRYPYTWDNPINLYDLDGREVCAGLGPIQGVSIAMAHRSAWSPAFNSGLYRAASGRADLRYALERRSYRLVLVRTPRPQQSMARPALSKELREPQSD